MDKQINQVIQRARGARYVDGTYEFKMGLTLVTLAAYTLIQTKLDGPGWSNFLLPLLFSFLLLGGGGWLIDRFIQLIKDRVTYRRSGYVSFDPKTKTPAFSPDTMLFFVVLGFLLALSLFTWLGQVVSTKAMPLLPAVILSVVVGFTAFRSAQRRFYLLAFVTLAIGIALAFIDNGRWDVTLSEAVYFAVVSLVFLSAGVFTLWSYLRTTIPVEDLPVGS
jgi:hypothetical protein